MGSCGIGVLGTESMEDNDLTCKNWSKGQRRESIAHIIQDERSFHPNTFKYMIV